MAVRTNHTAFKNLRAYRTAHGLSQKEAGDMFKISQLTWSRYERQIRHPKPTLAKRIAKATGVSVLWLLGL